MKLRFLITVGMACSILAWAQPKKTTPQLETQVRKAREQQEAYQQKMRAKIDSVPVTITSTGAAFPQISITTSEGVTITNKNIPADRPVLLILFNPMCDHCQKVANTIREQIETFSNTTVIFITGLNLIGNLNEFIDICKLKNIPNIIVGATDANQSAGLFQGKGIPQVMVYNKAQKLQKIFYETMQTDSTIYYLNKP